jgi:bacterioferritin-associated ferredoxin
MERPFPVPGWTLPGVMTAGAAQILFKTADVVPAGPVVLAGCGPLLLLLAAQYIRAGVRISAVVDTTGSSDWMRALPALPSALRDWRLLAKGMGLMRELRKSGTPYFKGASDIAIEGETQARAIRFRTAQGAQRVEAQLVLLHQGVIPNTQITRSLRAEHAWDEVQLCFTPRLSGLGELDGLPGFYVAGDGARIIGALASMASGRIAGLAAARAAPGANGVQDILARIAVVVRELQLRTAARPMLDRLYRPKAQSRIPPDSVMVCRCEEVTAGEIRRYVRAGCVGPNQLKAFSRCGMGPCQGRQCGITVCEIIAAERGMQPGEIGYQRVRAPIKPISVGELGGGQME